MALGPQPETSEEVAARNKQIEDIVEAAFARRDETNPPKTETIRRKKAVYVGAPAIFALEQACREINDAFGGFGCYLVGSALERADWRDVDVRFILEDEEFAKLFPNAHDFGWERDARWLLLTVSISGWLSKVTGLPIDFQIQPQTHANERHKGPRSALGIRITKG